jgi:hypothetical protein
MSGGPEEQRAGMVEMLFLDLVISARHQSVDRSVPGPAVEGVERGCPSPLREGEARREARGWSRSHYVISPALSGCKSRKFLGISLQLSVLPGYVINFIPSSCLI